MLNIEIKNSNFRTFSGLEYLLIDIANNIGFDKLNYDDRIAQAKNVVNFINVDTTDEVIKQIVSEVDADEPILLFAGLLAYRDTLAGKPTGHKVGLDSCCSGSQLMAVLTCDINTLALTNAIGNDRNDFYTVATEAYRKLINSNEQYSRADVKKAIMTSFYGSKNTPKKVLGKHNYEAFCTTIKTISPNCYQWKEDLINYWNPTVTEYSWRLPDGFTAYTPVISRVKKQFVTGNNTLTYQVKEKVAVQHGLANAANVVHSVDGYVMRELISRCNYSIEVIQRVYKLLSTVEPADKLELRNDYTKLSYLLETYNMFKVPSVRILNYIQTKEDVLRLGHTLHKKLLKLAETMLKYKPFEVIGIHDQFECLPNNCNYVRYWYNHILADLCDSNAYEAICYQIYPEGIEPTKFNTRTSKNKFVLAEMIRNNNYAIC